MTNCKELAALAEYIVHGNDKAIHWLKGSRYTTLAAFASAIFGDETALVYLLGAKNKEWALTAGAFKKDPTAGAMLMRSKKAHYLILAQTLIKFAKDNTLRSTGISSFGDDYNDSGSGFDGFGGGDFGGGGAGDSW